MAGRKRAKTARLGPNSNPAQVQAICIPTGLHCDVSLQVPMAVAFACVDQQLQLDSFEFEELTVQSTRKLSRARSVFRVPVVVQAAAVVKQGEGLDDANVGACGLSQAKTVAPYPRPVRRPVDSPPLKGEVLSEERDQCAASHGACRSNCAAQGGMPRCVRLSEASGITAPLGATADQPAKNPNPG